MPLPTAQEVIDAVVVEHFRPNARVMVSKARGLGQHIALKPEDMVPEVDAETDIFIQILDLSVDNPPIAPRPNPVFCSTEGCFGYTPEPCGECGHLVGQCACGSCVTECECVEEEEEQPPEPEPKPKGGRGKKAT